VWLLAGETAVVGAATVWAAWAAATTSAVSVQSALATPIFAAVMTAILGGLAYALSRFRAWARSPAIVIEMLMIPLGYYMITGGVPWLGIPVMLIGLVGTGLLLAPSTRTVLGLD